MFKKISGTRWNDRSHQFLNHFAKSPHSRVFLLLVFLGSGIASIVQYLAENGAIQNRGDDVIDDCKKISGLDPRRRDPDDAAEEEKSDGNRG